MAVEGLGDVSGNQQKSEGSEEQGVNLENLVPHKPIHPIDQEFLDAQQKTEDAKQTELDKARELHNRVTAGENPADVQKDLA